MFDSFRPGYVPILLPGDLDAFAATGRWTAALISAHHGTAANTRPLARLARERARCLLVDPQTAYYQYEGYMSREELRDVPFSPGRSTLGTLWQPRDFDKQARRAGLINDVFQVQRALHADAYLAPYFLISDVEHPWMQLAAQTLTEAIALDNDRPVGGVVCVEIDAILRPGQLETLTSAFAAAQPALWLLVVVNHDEVEANPAELRAVLRLIAALGRDGAPVVHAYAGRGGLVATASGAAGYAAGALELETHPKRYLREGLINLYSNSYYLPGAMVRLPIRRAQALVEQQPEAWGDQDRSVPITSLVSRRRIRRALQAKRAETDSLCTLGPQQARDLLRPRVERALRMCEQADRQLASTGHREQLGKSEYHYLEIMLELLGGPPANIPTDAGI